MASWERAIGGALRPRLNAADECSPWTRVDGQGPFGPPLRGAWPILDGFGIRYAGCMRRWEYKTFDLVKRRDEVEGLNRLGREGWEAVGIVSSWGVGWRMVHPIVLFKRALPDDTQ